MNYCTNCGAQIKEAVNFCTKCGKAVVAKDSQLRNDEYDPMASANGSLFSSKIFKIGLGLLGFIVLFFVINSIMTKKDLPGDSISITKELLKLEGKWYDPTGVLLGDKHAIINVVNKNENAIGKDDNGIMEFQLVPKGKNSYQARVKINGVGGDFDAKYDNQKKTLEFFSTLTKSSWKIKKF